MNTKLVVAALVLLPVLAHVGYASATSTFANYYVTVDQFSARSAAAPARVGGQIVPGSIRWDNGTRTMRFSMSGNGSTIDVVYRGAVPDAFRDGLTAIIEGTRGSDGALIASSIMIKCPHEYLPVG
jgi:cytochrome c-type biogenesis protein CcmE